MCTPVEHARRLATLRRLQRKDADLQQRAAAAERKVLQFEARIDGLEAQLEMLNLLASGGPLEGPEWLR